MLSNDDIEMIRRQAYIGCPSQLKNICEVQPYLIKDIIKMGTIYNEYLGLLLIDEVEIDKQLKKKGIDSKKENIDPLAFLMKEADNDDIFFLKLTEAFSTFIKEEVLLLPKINCVLIGPPSEKKLINKNNFSDFQNILRIQNGFDIEEPIPENETQFERKQRINRALVKKAKQKKQEKEEIEFSSLMEIADVFNIDFENATRYKFNKLFQRHRLKEEYDRNISFLCAGADPEKIQIKYWGNNPQT